MLRNYIKIAWRNVVKNPFYSLVNIAGLSAGIAFALLIAAYVWKELEVNKSLKNAGNQYIILSKWKNPDQGYELATLGPLAKSLHDNYPNLVANYYRYDGITSNVSKGDKSFREGIQVGDSTLLRMYGFGLQQGDITTALRDPFSVVVTAEVARKYFGKQDIVGETLSIDNFSGSRHEFKITGVLKPVEKNSATHLVEDYPNHFFVSTDNLSFFGRNMDWNNSSIASFIELKSGVKASSLEAPIRELVRQNTSKQVSDNLVPQLVQLQEYYLTANNGLVRKMLYALSGIALFILFMAVINFVNMSVSRSATRMREIGIRKVLGGLKKQLVVQFLVESTVLVFLAMMFAIGIYLLTRDLFSSIVGKEVPALSAFPIYFIIYPLLMIGVTGFIAGIYPAFVLSSLRMVESIKGKMSSVKENIFLRKGLVAFQFGTAAIVFAGAIIISRQVQLFFSQDLGYNKDLVIAAQVPRDWTAAGVAKMQTIRRELAAMPEISSATLSYEIPDGNNSGNAGVYRSGMDSSAAISSQILYTDEYYAQTYGIAMAAGEFYSREGALTDSFRVVINETQSRALGYNSAAEAIGGQLRFPGASGVFTIAGVTKDFHFGSMQKAIQPATFLHVGLTSTFRFISIKLKPGSMGSSIGAIQKKWSALMPGAPFEYRFMDETLERLYKTEIQLKRASLTATVLAIVIVLLGVLGLVSLSVQKRTREIGIRKVLGASVASIISLFLKEFTGVILLAGLIACPIAWLLMRGWLSDYAYRITLSAGPFLLALTSLAGITILLIIIQTLKAGLANPVKSLHTD